jgi:hypothetical protein
MANTLVDEKHFARATRDTGYRGTPAAVAELIDNAVQAGATDIHVLVHQIGSGKNRRVRLAVWDNGSGMDRACLCQALQWGGSTRFDDRSGTGRFGMGLPNSSVSQARRVEVYTWRSPTAILWSYLDLDEITTGRMSRVPSPRRTRVPKWVPDAAASGTLVVWSKTDRLDYRKASTIAAKLSIELGRIFRLSLWAGIRIWVNGTRIEPFDPLFLQTTSGLVGGREFSQPLTYEFKVSGRRRRTGTVVVRFSRLPVESWATWPADEKRRLGIVGGAGVSIVRASREIAHGWYFMGSKRRQNYDDWWRAEVTFDPQLDELFGVTHSKQGIRPRQDLVAVLSPDMERIAHLLSANVREAFASSSRPPTRGAAAIATSRDWRLARIHVGPSRGRVGHVQYRIEHSDLPSGDFCQWALTGSELVLTMNKNHVFFERLCARADQEGSKWLRHDLECLVLGFARAAEMTNPSAARVLCSAWSDTLATFVGE